VLAVYASVREAADRARAGGGPAFLEMLTYRIGAHSSSDDPRVYRDEAEVEVWKKRDPLERFLRYLTGRSLWGDEQETEAREALGKQIAEAVAAAESRPPPEVTTMFDDVYAERLWHLEEQREGHLSAETE
jgi:pyruvate dehydrogenase E1 component alpha subunit/2-oxoisovalerate dehydrogenase E1 component alpha subunit